MKIKSNTTNVSISIRGWYLLSYLTPFPSYCRLLVEFALSTEGTSL